MHTIAEQTKELARLTKEWTDRGHSKKEAMRLAREEYDYYWETNQYEDKGPNDTEPTAFHL